MKYILKKTLSYFVLILFVTYGCTQDDFETVNDESKSINLSIANDSEQLQIEFGKVLAKGLYNSNELRLLIKTKALKQFNKDYDVLYHLIKDESLENGTVESYLSSFATSTAEYLEMVEQLPLLTIFVPSLPDFSAENWNVDEEIPQVAVRLQYDRNVPLYDYNENIDIIEANCIPAVPVVVVKLNERVKVREQGSLKSTAVDSPLAFEFIDDCYNPKNDNRLKGARWHPAITNDIRHGFDVVSGKAWSYYERSNHEMWQRDHVYYQMTDKITTGAYRNTYKEFITGIKLSNATGIPIFADQAPDQMFLDGAWTDGAFEFVINILINSKNGAGRL